MEDDFADISNLERLDIKNVDKDKVYELLDLIRNYGLSDNFDDVIKSFKNEVLNSDDLDKVMHLSAAYIAKYSRKLWINNDKPCTDVILADVMGFLAGYSATRHWIPGLFVGIVASYLYEIHQSQ